MQKWIQLKTELNSKLDWQDADKLGQLVAIVRQDAYMAGYLEALWNNPATTREQDRHDALASYIEWLKTITEPAQ